MDEDQDVILLDEEENQPNQPQQELNSQEPAQVEKSKGIPQPIFKEHEEYPTEGKEEDVILVEDKPETLQQKEMGMKDYWNLGFKESVSGEIDQLLLGSIPEKDRTLAKEPSFWQSVVQSAGTITGDLPFMIAGGMIGTALGMEGGPAVAAGAGAFGTGALPGFLRESLRQYREFNDKGNDLSFGEFLANVDKGAIANSTLNEGANGLLLGSINKGMHLLKKIPYLDKLFGTKYVGTPIRKATELGVESTLAATIPAISQGKLPSINDISHAAVLFAGMKSGELPTNIHNAWRHYKSDGFNLALAAEIQNQNLAYPPLMELKNKKVDPIYKNNVELDRNLAAFDLSFAESVAGKINALSPMDLTSTHDAGTLMKTMLVGQTPETSPSALNPPRIAVAPVFTETPLIMNPIVEGINRVSPTQFRSDLQAGNRIQEVYHKNRAEAKEPLDQRYQEQRAATREVEFVDTEAPVQIEEFISQFEGSEIPGSPEARLLNASRALLNRFIVTDQDGNITGYRNVNAADLIADNKAIKSIPDWEITPTVKENLGRLTGQIDELIVHQLEQFNPELALEYQQLNEDYHSFKSRYDNSDTQIMFKRTEKGEAIYKRFSNTDQFMSLTNALETSPEGIEVLNQMRRDIWTKELPERLLHARTETEFANALAGITDRQFNNLAEILTPQQQASMVNSIAQGNQLRSAAQMAAQQHDAALRQHELDRLADRDTQRQAKDIQSKQSVLVSLLSKDPAKLMENMDTIEGIRRTYNALDRVQGGQEVKNALARFETENMLQFLREGFVETGRVPYKKLKNQMSNKDFRSKLAALNGPEFVESMDALVKVTDQLSDSFLKQQIKYKYDPATYSSLINLGTLIGVVQSGSIIGPMVVHGKIKAMKAGLEKATNFWIDKANYDQKHIKQVIEAAKAIKAGDAAEIQRQAHKLAPIKTKRK